MLVATHQRGAKMPDTPDINLDAAAYFRHLRKVGFELDRHQRWCFSFRAENVEGLEALGEFLDVRLREFFHVMLQDTVEEVDENGVSTEGNPMLRVEFVGVID